MEVIHLSGYTEDEKVAIAKRHLIPRLMERHGLKDTEWAISEPSMRDLIRYYTREAGVRSLERELANLTRKAVKDILLKKYESVQVTRRNLGTYAGVRRYRHGEIDHGDSVGITNGLAYTDTGGDLLLIETVSMPGKGKITPTGKLGEVMQESVQASWSYVRSRAIEFGIKPPLFGKRDVHVHVPEGAIPKDGPSAGIAITTSLVSVLTGIPVKSSLAMTGEVTLRGRVLPIGGLKEKLLAALRGGLTTVLIPKENEKDLSEIPENVKKGLEIIPVGTVDEVLKLALCSPLSPIEWVEADEEVDSVAKQAQDEGEDTIVTH